MKVYHCTFGNRLNSTIGEFRKWGLIYTQNEPFDEMLWKPYMITTESAVCYYFLFLLLQVIPAAIVDTALRFTGKKPRYWRPH